MPGLSPFEAGRSIGHGRLARSTAPDGAYVFELGDNRKTARDLAIGDYIEVSQTTTLEAASTHVTFDVRVDPPAELDPGMGWQLSARLNNVELWASPILAGGSAYTQTIVLSLATANVKVLPTNTDTIAIRLEAL